MSWIDTINDKLIITCGDGKQFNPLWKNARKGMEFNTTVFEFVNIEGALVKREMPKAQTFELELYFTGDDHLNEALAFEQSSKDSRAWEISHPIYGRKTVQPAALTFDYTDYNVTMITGTVMETITEDNPRSTEIPLDKITADKEVLDEQGAASFAENLGEPLNSSDKTTLTNTQANYYSQGAKSITDTTEAETFLNLFNEANAAIIEGTTEPEIAMAKIQAFINYPPGLLSDTVTGRLTLLSDQYNTLALSVANLTTKNQKVSFQANAGSFIANMAIAASNPQPGNYGTRIQVTTVINLLLYYYNLYLAALDALQSANNGSPTSYVPDPVTLTGLDNIIKYTLSNLFNIAMGSKQERSIYIEDDSNVINLAHRFYGLQVDDSTIDTLIANNDIGISELLLVKKGRKIIYYI